MDLNHVITLAGKCGEVKKMLNDAGYDSHEPGVWFPMAASRATRTRAEGVTEEEVKHMLNLGYKACGCASCPGDPDCNECLGGVAFYKESSVVGVEAKFLTRSEILHTLHVRETDAVEQFKDVIAKDVDAQGARECENFLRDKFIADAPDIRQAVETAVLDCVYTRCGLNGDWAVSAWFVKGSKPNGTWGVYVLDRETSDYRYDVVLRINDDEDDDQLIHNLKLDVDVYEAMQIADNYEPVFQLECRASAVIKVTAAQLADLRADRGATIEAHNIQFSDGESYVPKGWNEEMGEWGDAEFNINLKQEEESCE